MADTKENPVTGASDLSVEEMATKRAEITKYYEDHIPSLETQLQYETLLRDIEKMPYEEISNIVDVPLGTVKSRINRARIQLQKDLKDYI